MKKLTEPKLTDTQLHCLFTSLSFSCLPPPRKEHLSDVFFHLAYMEGELICTVKFYISSSFIFFSETKKGRNRKQPLHMKHALVKTI